MEPQDIDAKNTEINRRKVKITTGNKAILKLKKAVEDAAKEKASFTEDKEKRTIDFKEIEKKALIVEEKYKNLKEVTILCICMTCCTHEGQRLTILSFMQILDKQLEELESAQKEYNDIKKVVEGLRTGEVGKCVCEYINVCMSPCLEIKIKIKIMYIFI